MLHKNLANLGLTTGVGFKGNLNYKVIIGIPQTSIRVNTNVVKLVGN